MRFNPTFGGYMTLLAERTVRLAVRNVTSGALERFGESGEV
jgi:hypothetical protein